MVMVVANLQVPDCPWKKAVEVPSTVGPHWPRLPLCLGASLYSARSWLVQQIFISGAESLMLFMFASIFRRRLMHLLLLCCKECTESFSIASLRPLPLLLVMKCIAFICILLKAALAYLRCGRHNALYAMNSSSFKAGAGSEILYLN